MKPTEKKTLRDTDVQPIGMYGVFRHSRKFSTARFVALHNTYESASKEAVRLATTHASQEPTLQHIYYVVEIVASFQVGPEGLKSEER